MVRELFYLAVYVIEAVIAYIYFADNFDKKIKTPLSVALSIGIYIVAFGANLACGSNFIINLVWFFIINIIYSLVAFKISWKQSLFHSSILVAVMFITEILVESIFTTLLSLPIDAYANSISALIIIGVICKTLYLIVCKVISSLYSYKKAINKNSIKRTYALFIYPITSTIMIGVFQYTSVKYKFSNNVNLVCSAVSVLSIIMSCVIFIINQNIIVKDNEIITLQSEKQKNEINKTFYEMLEKKNEEERIFIHDIKHHLSILGSMNTVDDIQNYISSINKDVEEYEFIGKSNNKMLDLILSKYSYLCEKNNISFNVDVHTANLNFIDNNDLTSLLSNLLDNAIEACKDCNNAYIIFTTKTERNFVVANIINSSKKEPKTIGDELYTSKTNDAFHGFGIKSIKKIAKKYDGVYHWEYNKALNEFHSTLLFNT